MGHIVVGVDGSEAAHEALTWALEQAEARGSDLHVVHTYGPDGEESPYAPSYAYAPDLRIAEKLTEEDRRWREEHHRRVQDRAVRMVNDLVKSVGADRSKVTVQQEVIASSRAAQTLIDLAEGAELLVVGSRGRGGFKGLMLGSVSQQCTHHATCPVVVVRPKDTDA